MYLKYFSASFISIVFQLTAFELNAETYRVGIVPQQSASKLAKQWVPILNYVSRESGHKLIFKTATDIPAFEKQLANGKYDLAYMNPYHYTVYHQNSNYHAIAKARNKRLKGIIVTRKDSKKNKLEDFRGKTLVFPSPNAFAASILTQAEFSQRHINIDAKYVSSHDSVYRNVAQGRYPAGGGVLKTFNNIDNTIQQQLKIIWTTKGYTPHAIAAHKNISTDHIHSIQRAFIQLSETENGRRMLAKVNLSGFESAQNTDWDDVRNLNIELLNN
ncbi:ABC transporter, substrate-binding protein (cluster 12, methionine/phosphonates) [hydrothermal vent metagenome]|uniref:ABC transporter, substrate-binding protein (Cluster 12, methionine/phosphonates) n=1 Tax=hydrothermal vent metagenome TaxID=652676 RepID=A0A3B0XGC6_9ZZZZ